MTDISPRPEGYEEVKCEIKLPGCQKTYAGYLRRLQYAQEGPWVNACQICAEKPYEPPKQFQEEAQ